MTMKLYALKYFIAVSITLPLIISCNNDTGDSTYFAPRFDIHYECLKGSSVAEMVVSYSQDGEAERTEVHPVVLSEEGNPILIFGWGIFGEFPPKAFSLTFHITAPSVSTWVGRTDTLEVSYNKHCRMKKISYNGVNLENAYSDNPSGVYVERIGRTSVDSHSVIHVTK